MLEAVLGHLAPRARQPRRWIILGAEGMIGESAARTTCTLEQKLFLFSRADTIYGGSNEIQHNVLGERVLGPAAWSRRRPQAMPGRVIRPSSDAWSPATNTWM